MADKIQTQIKCRKCLKKNIISFLEKQPWGENKNQHFRLTCTNPECDFTHNDVNQNFINLIEGMDKEEDNNGENK